MVIRVHTPKPRELLTAIQAAIETGRVEAWSCDPTGAFAPTPPDGVNGARLRPEVTSGVIEFRFIADTPLTRASFGALHGRFIEMLLAHFYEELTAIVVPTPSRPPTDPLGEG